jgi:hypothetical protein
MTTELQEYKCPSCGHLLGQQEYLHACEKLEGKLIEQLQQQRLQHEKEMHEKDEQFARNVESIVSVRMSKGMAEQRVRQAKENEAIRNQALNEANERIRQVISEKDIENRQIENQYHLRISRLDDDNKKLRLQVEEQRKRLDSISSETKGTAGENGLLEDLKQEFKTDEFTCKKNGAAMADIIQTIVTETGERIETPIAYDKKMGSKVIKTDLEKAKNYKRIHNTDYCIIVTTDIKETSPRRFTEVRDGILLVHPTVLIDIAKRIRNFIIDNSRLEKINVGKDSKKDRLYELFTNAEYCRDLQARMDLKSKLEELQHKDEQSLNKRKDLISRWYQLDMKYESMVKDITQDEKDGGFPSL